MRLSHIVTKICLGVLPAQAVGRALRGKPSDLVVTERAPLQDIVTWDEHSLSVHGQRIIFWGGEVHPFRFVSVSRHVFRIIYVRAGYQSQGYGWTSSRRSERWGTTAFQYTYRGSYMSPDQARFKLKAYLTTSRSSTRPKKLGCTL